MKTKESQSLLFPEAENETFMVPTSVCGYEKESDSSPWFWWEEPSLLMRRASVFFENWFAKCAHENWVSLQVWHLLPEHVNTSYCCYFCSVAQSYLTLWPRGLQHSRHPSPSSTPGAYSPHVHQVSDAIQPSYPLSSPSPPALSLSQHQGLFQWVSSSHHVAKVLQLQPQHQPLQWTADDSDRIQNCKKTDDEDWQTGHHLPSVGVTCTPGRWVVLAHLVGAEGYLAWGTRRTAHQDLGKGTERPTWIHMSQTLGKCALSPQEDSPSCPPGPGEAMTPVGSVPASVPRRTIHGRLGVQWTQSQRSSTVPRASLCASVKWADALCPVPLVGLAWDCKEALGEWGLWSISRCLWPSFMKSSLCPGPIPLSPLDSPCKSPEHHCPSPVRKQRPWYIRLLFKVAQTGRARAL